MRKPEMKEYQDRIEIILPKEFLVKNHIITDIRGTGDGFVINSDSHPIDKCHLAKNQPQNQQLKDEDLQIIRQLAQKALGEFLHGPGKNYQPTGASTLDGIVPKKHQPEQSEIHRNIWNQIKLNQEWEK